MRFELAVAKMTAHLSVLIGVLLLAGTILADHEPAADSDGVFQVSASPFSSCSRLNASLDCYRTRQTACVRASDNITAPWYYCDSLERYSTVEACPQGSCVQNCTVSQWSAWSSCNCSLDPFSIRSRSVVSPPRNGGQPCPGLLERSLCGCSGHLPFDAQPRRFTWQTGRWLECSPRDAGAQCGVGLRSRTVECVGVDSRAVVPSNCLQEPAYSNLHPPSPEMLCEIPCSCLLGDWEPYSTCTPLCNARPLVGEQTRTRPITRPPTHGLSCEEVKQTRSCSVSTNTCPLYLWETSDWSPCMFQTGATCGTGHMTRYAYCTKVLAGMRSVVVEDSKCQSFADNTTKPALLRSCESSCPQPCQVGEWTEWADCPRECRQTYSNRTRSVIVPPLDEEVCPHTVELRPCPILQCARYFLGEPIAGCIRLEGGCGLGEETNDIKCVGPDDVDIGLAACSNFPYPLDLLTEECHIPCPDDCAVSDWSEWSSCSETCGGLVGSQTRLRHFVARGTNCPYKDSNLTETRSCSQPEECGLTRYYIQEEPWGMCIAGEDTMQSSASPPEGGLLRTDESGSSSCVGSGVRNKTRQCMRNGSVVTASECPLAFQAVLLESCELPCTVDCVLSEWSVYSDCSVSCGTGMRYRTRRLLQFPTTSDLSECGVSDEDDLMEDGLLVESATCQVQACEEVRGVNWYETSWSSCTLYNTISANDIGSLEPGSCGLGFQTRNATCMEVGTGVVVSDSRCYNTIGPRSSLIRSCHIQCEHRCLVTEWSDFTTCEFGGNTTTHREVVPVRYCSDPQECCPELSSLKVSQSLSCPSFQTCYGFAESSPYSQCIVESPLETCGNGNKHRSFVCLDRCATIMQGEQVVVDLSFCTLAGQSNSEVLTAACNIRCQRNCIQSEWSGWSPCAVTCGSGVRTRSRSTESRGEEGGRPCGPEVETDVCIAESCSYVEVVPGPFGSCVPHNSTSLCGPGQRTREALCFVSGEPRDHSECLGHEAVSFPLNESCISSCPGECVISEWGEWSPCNTDCPFGSCQRHRERTILREGHEACMEMTQEFQICFPPEDPYRWNAQPWKDCVIGSPNSGVSGVPGQGHYCGKGVHSRIVSCNDTSSGAVLPDYLCVEAGLAKPSVMENCSIPCPIDCLVGAFSDWTECEACVYNSLQRRVRSVVVAPMFDGEECPDLEQTRPCVPTNCIASARVNHTPLIATDYTLDSQCGSALVRQPISCRINTAFMSPLECRAGEDEPQELYEVQSCPREPNCTFGEWSDWSECLSLCHTPEVLFRFRARQLISSLPGLAAACEAQHSAASAGGVPRRSGHPRQRERK